MRDAVLGLSLAVLMLAGQNVDRIADAVSAWVASWPESRCPALESRTALDGKMRCWREDCGDWICQYGIDDKTRIMLEDL